MGQYVSRTITQTISTNNATAATAATALDAAVLAAQNAIITTPPAGIVGNVTLGPVTVIYSGSVYEFVQQLQYNTQQAQ